MNKYLSLFLLNLIIFNTAIAMHSNSRQLLDEREQRLEELKAINASLNDQIHKKFVEHTDQSLKLKRIDQEFGERTQESEQCRAKFLKKQEEKYQKILEISIMPNMTADQLSQALDELLKS